jgi:hypothetical protein
MLERHQGLSALTNNVFRDIQRSFETDISGKNMGIKTGTTDGTTATTAVVDGAVGAAEKAPLSSLYEVENHGGSRVNVRAIASMSGAVKTTLAPLLRVRVKGVVTAVNAATGAVEVRFLNIVI